MGAQLRSDARIPRRPSRPLGSIEGAPTPDARRASTREGATTDRCGKQRRARPLTPTLSPRRGGRNPCSVIPAKAGIQSGAAAPRPPRKPRGRNNRSMRRAASGAPPHPHPLPQERGPESLFRHSGESRNPVRGSGPTPPSEASRAQQPIDAASSVGRAPSHPPSPQERAPESLFRHSGESRNPVRGSGPTPPSEASRAQQPIDAASGVRRAPSPPPSPPGEGAGSAGRPHPRSRSGTLTVCGRAAVKGPDRGGSARASGAAATTPRGSRRSGRRTWRRGAPPRCACRAGRICTCRRS